MKKKVTNTARLSPSVAHEGVIGWYIVRVEPIAPEDSGWRVMSDLKEPMEHAVVVSLETFVQRYRVFQLRLDSPVGSRFRINTWSCSYEPF